MVFVLTDKPIEISKLMTISVHKNEGVNHTRNVQVSPFVSTGKEKDVETGYGYFGARYIDQDLTTLFLSVDPMADKYPSINPYAYCMWNPIKLVDPDGRDFEKIIDHEKKNNNDKSSILLF